MRDTELNRAFKYFADDVVEVMNGELDDKADKATTYTKTEIDNMIGDINTVLEEVL